MAWRALFSGSKPHYTNQKQLQPITKSSMAARNPDYVWDKVKLSYDSAEEAIIPSIFRYTSSQLNGEKIEHIFGKYCDSKGFRLTRPALSYAVKPEVAKWRGKRKPLDPEVQAEFEPADGQPASGQPVQLYKISKSLFQ